MKNPESREINEILGVNEEELEKIAMLDEMRRPQDGTISMHKWLIEKGYDIDIKFNLDLFWSSWDKNIKKSIVVVNKVGLSNLQGKSVLFTPGGSDVGLFQYISEGGKVLALGLNATVEQLVGAVDKYIIRGEKE